MDDTLGIVGWRVWSLENDSPLLESVSGVGGRRSGGPWSSPMQSDKVPGVDNNSGLYCFTFDKPATEVGKLMLIRGVRDTAIGVVECRGKILIHTDQVMRAQWARVLALWVPSSVSDEHLSRLFQAYRCPVAATDDFVASIELWKSGAGSELIKQNVFKVACFGTLAASAYGTPLLSREVHHPGSSPPSDSSSGALAALDRVIVAAGIKGLSKLRSPRTQLVCLKCNRVFGNYSSSEDYTYCPDDGFALLPFRPTCGCGRPVRCDYIVGGVWPGYRVVPGTERCPTCGARLRPVVESGLKAVKQAAKGDKKKR